MAAPPQQDPNDLISHLLLPPPAGSPGFVQCRGCHREHDPRFNQCSVCYRMAIANAERRRERRQDEIRSRAAATNAAQISLAGRAGGVGHFGAAARRPRGGRMSADFERNAALLMHEARARNARRVQFMGDQGVYSLKKVC
nr:hypothetical protein [Crucivirus sp.]